MFHLPLSLIASWQCDQLASIIGDREENSDPDHWHVSNVNKPYSSKRVYDVLSPNEIAPVLMRWIWKSCVLPKHKFFFWLLLQDRLNTFWLERILLCPLF